MKRDERMGEAIYGKRKEKGLTQGQLGNKLGLSAATIGRLEHGDAKVLSRDKLKKVLSYLKIDYSRFMRDEEKSPAPEAAGSPANNAGTDSPLKEAKKRIRSEAVIGDGSVPIEQTRRNKLKELWNEIKDDARYVSPAVVKSPRAPGREKRTEPTTVASKVSGEIYEKIREYGKGKGMSISQVVSEAVERFFAVPGPPKEAPVAVAAPPRVSIETPVEGQGVSQGEDAIEDGEAFCEEGDEGLATCEEIEMLQKAGHTYEAIGELMGLGADKVRQVVEREKMMKRELERKEFLKKDLKSLDLMQKLLWDKVCKGSNSAIDLVLRIMEHRSKLVG